jgi:transcription initiation factor TFIID subunit TAF12
MSFIQYCILLGYLKKKKKQKKKQQLQQQHQQKQKNTRLNTSYTKYIVFILSSTISYPSRNGTGFY